MVSMILKLQYPGN